MQLGDSLFPFIPKRTHGSLLLFENNMPTNDDRSTESVGPQGLTSLLTQDDLFWVLFYKREEQLSYLPLVFGIFCYMQQ